MLDAIKDYLGPWTYKILTYLGMGIISITGLTKIVNGVIDNLTAFYDGMPSHVLAIANMLGVGTAIGIVAGAILARAVYAAMPKLGILTS